MANDEEDTLTLFLVNRDQEADLLLQGYLASTRGYRWSGTRCSPTTIPKATNTMDHPNNVVPQEGGGATLDDEGRLEGRPSQVVVG